MTPQTQAPTPELVPASTPVSRDEGPGPSLGADLIIANAPDPVFVSDLEGKILQANDAVSQLLGFRPDEVLEQSLSRIISPTETREFLAALREVVERGVTRNARLNPRSASGEVIPTTLNASALRDSDGNVIGAIGVLRDMRAYEQVVRDLEQSKAELQEKILDLEKFEEVVVGRELKMIALEKELESVKEELSRALLHIMGDLHDSNRKLGDQRKAMLHILKDANETNLKLADSRKAMIHIMGDLRETTQEIERREQELRDKQEQLVQAGKLATLGELTTGVAHELNNPLNNIGLYIGNVIDRAKRGELKGEMLVSDLSDDDAVVLSNPIQLEQVFINLLTNARDALEGAKLRKIRISSRCDEERVYITFADTGPGIPPDVESRVFDPFFTTKEVGSGTGLGLSITYSIVKEHGGEISVASKPGEGATFRIELPRGGERPAE